MDQLSIKFMLDGGTLLGFYRDDTFCEDDHDDIDLTTFEDSGQIEDILEAAAEKGFCVYRVWKKTPTTTAQLSVKRCGVKIDLMFKEMKGPNAWWTVFKKGVPTYKAVYAGDYLPCHPFQTRLGVFMVPGEDTAVTEFYLEHRYGNWRQKVHRKDYSCYRDDRSIKQSYEEI